MATTQLGRRAFLQAAVATTGGVLVSGSLETILSGAAGATPAPLPLGPVADLRDGKVRLHLPRGFRYRSFHDTDVLTGSPPITLDDGTVLPGRHDGMAAFRGRHGTVWLVRNHEVNGPVAAPFGPGEPYDHHTGGGTTTIRVTPDGHVLEAFTSLNGTQMNCSGGAMPWGSWITCEETVNGPDVGADFTNAPNVTLEQRHGFLFEVPAGGQSNREPITSAGRFAHEAAAYSPHEGYVYLTEDNFAFPSGLYRYRPPVNPMRAGRLVNGGRLQMLRVKGAARGAPRGGAGHRRQLQGGVGGHRRPEPHVPVHARPAGTHHEQRSHRLRRRRRAARRAPPTSPAWRARPSRRARCTSRPRRAADRRRPARS